MEQIILKPSILLFGFFIFGIFLISTGTNDAFAVTKTWNQPIGGDFHDPNNWNPVGVPLGSEDIIIDVGFNVPREVVALSSDFTLTTGTITIVHNVELRAPFGITLTINPQGSVFLGAPGGVLRPNGGTIINNGLIMNQGLLFTPLNLFTNSGILNIASNWVNNINANPTNTVNGIINILPGGSISLTHSSATFNNLGVINNVGSISNDNGGTFDNQGIINNCGGSTSGPITGTISTNCKYWDGGGDGSSWNGASNWRTDGIPSGGEYIIIGDADLGTGSVVQLNTDLTLTGTIILESGDSFQIQGSRTLTNQGTVTSYGAVNNQGTFTNDCGGEFNDYGTFSGSPVVNCDTTPPVSSIDSAFVPDIATGAQINDGDFTMETSIEFTFSGTDNVSPPNALTFQCQLDGGGYSNCTSPHQETPLAEGAHTFEVKATDEAGNEESTASFSWTVDITVPIASIDTHFVPDGNGFQRFGNIQSPHTSAEITFSGTDNLSSPAGLTFECKEDFGVFAACSSPVQLTNLGSNSQFRVRAIDEAGNVGLEVLNPLLIDPTLAIKAEADTSSTFSSATSYTLPSFTVSPGNNRLLLVDIATGGTATNIQSVSFGNQMLTEVISNRPFGTEQVAIYSLVAPDVETNDIVVTGDLSAHAVIGATYYTGVHQTVPILDTFQNSGTDDTPTTTFTGVVDDTLVVNSIFATGGGTPPTPPPAQWLHWNELASPFGLHGATGSRYLFPVTFFFTWNLPSGPQPWGTAVVTLTPFDTVDNTPPVSSIDSAFVPDIATGVQISDGDLTDETSIEFNFSGTDNVSQPGDLTFECQLDGGGYSACTSPHQESSLAVGSHNFEVRAEDEFGTQESTASFSWTVTPSDTTPPVVFFVKVCTPNLLCESTNLPDGSFTHQTVVSFEISGTDDITQPQNLSFECSLDLEPFAACGTTFFRSGLSEAIHTMTVRAIDKAGNTSTEEVWTFGVDGTNPVMGTISAFVPDNTGTEIMDGDSTMETSIEFNFSGTDNVSQPGDLTFMCNLDVNGDQLCTSPHMISNVSPGLHTLSIRTIDLAGRSSPYTNFQWTVDTLPPVSSIDSAFVPDIATGTQISDGDSTVETSIEFNFSGTDNVSLPSALTFECQLDGGGYSACTSPHQESSLSIGAHTFNVRATDEAGNTESTASFMWTISLGPDMTPPVSSMTQLLCQI